MEFLIQQSLPIEHFLDVLYTVGVHTWIQSFTKTQTVLFLTSLKTDYCIADVNSFMSILNKTTRDKVRKFKSYISQHAPLPIKAFQKRYLF